jgi:hypothetical protein
MEAKSAGAAAAAEGAAAPPSAAERARLFVSHEEIFTAAKMESRGVFIAGTRRDEPTAAAGGGSYMLIKNF